MEVNVVEAKKNFSDLMARVAYGGQRLIIERHGKPMMAWVNMADYARLQQSEQDSQQVIAARLATLEQANRLRAMIRERRNGEPLSDSVDLIDQMRKEQMRRYDDLR